MKVEESNLEDYSEFKSNREKTLEPKLGKFWCYKCDREIVYAGQKCPACGFLAEKRFKKEKI